MVGYHLVRWQLLPPTRVLLLPPVTLSFYTPRVPISLVVLAATWGY